VARARGIYELGTSQQLSSPEILWKSYIDFEISEGERDKARALYERLVGLSGHWKVWISWAKFEGMDITLGGDDEDEEEEGEGGGVQVLPGDKELARGVWRKGYDALKARGEVDGVSYSLKRLRWN
jgi:crooked neck